MGKNCISEVLKHHPERIKEVYFSSHMDEGNDFLFELQKAGLTCKPISKKELANICQSESHQGFAALVKEAPQSDLKEFLSQSYEKDRSFVVALDSIFDPQNLGSILRSCECFAVDAVLWSKNRGVGITPTVTKASVGASELLPQIRVSNLAETVKRFQDAGYEVYTTECDDSSQDAYDFDFPEKTLLIMGSEGKGVQNLLSKRADGKLHLPMEGKISSLNVSQALLAFLTLWKKGLR